MKIELKVVREPTKEDKLAPQAAVVVKTIVGKVGLNAFIDQGEVIAELEANEEAGVEGLTLNTRQPPSRILSFYKKPLIDAGIIEVQKTIEVKEKAEGHEDAEPKAKKPRKAKAAEETASEGHNVEAAAA